ncbi:hypothetical protein [Flavipsychrobacter stenotrophus]|nr:hypothetical protein [Flavipsychrobacter stenotrophus]
MDRTTLIFVGLIMMVCIISKDANGQAPKHSIKATTAAQLDSTFYSVPDFYSASPRFSRDTMFIFRCYDKHDSLIKYVNDYEQVRYYSEFKEYTDSFHTYKDTNGVKQFLPVSTIVRRYDRVARDKWMCIQYPGNKYTELRANQTEDAGSTMIFIDKTGDGVADWVRVFNYYKTTEVGH